MERKWKHPFASQIECAQHNSLLVRVSLDSGWQSLDAPQEHNYIAALVDCARKTGLLSS